MRREKAQAETPRGRKYRRAYQWRTAPYVAMKRSNYRGAKGQVIHVVASQRATGRTRNNDGRRRPSSDGTSRMRRESHVRICERLGVKLHGPTRPWV